MAHETTSSGLISALHNASQYMGIKELKPKQVEVITTFVSGKDTCFLTNGLREVYNLCNIAFIV